MAGPLKEGALGTAKDGTRVIVRGGQWVKAPEGLSDTKTDHATLAELRSGARQMDMVAQRAAEFGEINRQAGTGMLLGLNPPWGNGGISALVKPFNRNIAAMEAITSDVVPQKRPPGSGASSDKDTSIYRGSFPSVDNTGNANKQIRQGIERERDRKLKQSQFYDDYFAKNRSLIGVESAWQAAQAASSPPVQRAAPPRAGAAPPKPVPSTSGAWKIERVERPK
jgi:hypothetical protein